MLCVVLLFLALKGVLKMVKVQGRAVEMLMDIEWLNAWGLFSLERGYLGRYAGGLWNLGINCILFYPVQNLKATHWNEQELNLKQNKKKREGDFSCDKQ